MQPTAELLLGDCLDVLPGMPEASVDTVVTDPPYALTEPRSSFGGCTRGSKSCPRTEQEKAARMGGFMGKSWDAALPSLEHWQAILRVLKPGGYLLSFGGTRTYHRLVCLIEDASFEIRDCLMWLHGQGFPKGNGCLKPAWEPIVLARRRGKRVLPLNIDGCRIEAQRTDTRVRTSLGRHPANLILDEATAAMVDEQSGASKGSPTRALAPGLGYHGGAKKETVAAGHPDSGGASRFFYCAKASRVERNAGCDGLPELSRQQDGNPDNWDLSEGKVRTRPQTRPQGNHHPTVKPLALMRWLVRLITQDGATVLDPFAGSGTTGVACLMEGRSFIGIEREPAYAEIARKRLQQAQACAPLFDKQPDNQKGTQP